MRAKAILLLTALLIAAPAAAQLTGEHLAAPADPIFRLGFADSRGSSIQEYIPAGETVDDWTRMITIQRFSYRPGLTPVGVLRPWLAGLARVCGVAAPPAPTAITADGHAAADARFDCPRNPATGKPETVLAHVVVGDWSVHWVQAATRRAPDAADLAWARRVIAGTTLCGSDSTDRRCMATQNPSLRSPL